jgi:hypothetical protein
MLKSNLVAGLRIFCLPEQAKGAEHQQGQEKIGHTKQVMWIELLML